MSGKITALAVLLLLVFSFIFIPYANASEEQDPGSYWGGQFNLKEESPGESVLTRIFANFLIAPVNFLTKIIGLQDPVTLIFGIVPGDKQPPEGFMPPEERILYTFTEEQFGAVSRFFDSARGFLLPLVVAALAVIAALTAVKTLGFGGSSRDRAEIKDLLTGSVVFFVSIAVLPAFLELFFGITWLLTKFAASVAGADALKHGFLRMIPEVSGYSLGSVLVAWLFIFSIGLLNFQYNLRLLALGILILLFPFAAFISVFPARRGTISMWFSQLWSNLLLQPAHAFVFAFFVLFAGIRPNFWLMMALFVGLNTMTILVRQIFGGETGGIGSGISSVLGISALMGIARMGIQAARHGAMMRTIRKETDDIEDALRDRPGGAYGIPGGTTDAAGTAQAGSAGAVSNTASFIRVKDKHAPLIHNPGVAKTYRSIGAAIKGAAATYGTALGAAAAGTLTGAAFGDASPGAQFGGLGGMTLGLGAGGRFYNILDAHADTHEKGFPFDPENPSKNPNYYRSEVDKRFGIYDYGTQMMDPEAAAEIGRNKWGAPGAVAYRAASFYHRIRARSNSKAKENLEKAVDARKKVEDMRMMSISDAKNVKHITDTVELLERRAAKARAEGDVEQAEKHEEALQAFKLELLQKQAQLSEHYTGMQELMLKHGIRPYAHYGVDASLEKSLK